ncbi:MAG TPA: hypothetical protein VF334_21010 [Polyangia bacterium]
MIRQSLLVAALLFVGCGDDTTSSSSQDLATVSDMAVPLDMTALSCNSILSCQAGCGQNLVCQAACRDSGTTGAKGLYDAFSGCVALSCSSADGGSGACNGPTDTRAACQACLTNTATQAPSTTAACHAEYVACASS